MAIETSVWIYWFCCAAALLVLLLGKERFSVSLLSPDSLSFEKDRKYFVTILIGWTASVLAATGYVLSTHKYETGNYEIPDLLFFSFFNGALEQFMFIFWLLVGCFIGRLLAPNKPGVIFASGFIVYAIFSGLIHALFWTSVLPPHKPVTVLMALILAVMSGTWMWLFWRYRALVTIIAMHIFVDFFMISHLHFAWFEPFQF